MHAVILPEAVDVAKPRDLNPWIAEASAMELSDCDEDVAWAAELPDEVLDLVHDWDPKLDFRQESADWFEYLCSREDQLLLLALEQCCHEGILLPWDMRAVRLATAPLEAIAGLHLFWDHAPRAIAACLTYRVYWQVRAERGRRRGSPDWSPHHPLPPVKEERAFFRPSTLRLRRPWP